jgi:proteic killer suppression protein
MAILSFSDETSRDIYNGVNSKASRRIAKQLWPRIAMKLDQLNAAASLNDLKSPGNQLEKLQDDLAGYWSIRVNVQYRICFQFGNGNASNVFCEDIH